MKATRRTTTMHKLLREVELARFRLARAQCQLVAAKEQARVAKRRRREAKHAARRAKRQARLAKREVAEAKLILSKVKAKLAHVNQTAVDTKTRKRTVLKAISRPRNKPLARNTGSRATKSVKRKPAPTKRPKLVVTVATEHKGSIVSLPVEPPALTASRPGTKEATEPGRELAEGRARQEELDKSVAPAAMHNESQPLP